MKTCFTDIYSTMIKRVIFHVNRAEQTVQRRKIYTIKIDFVLLCKFQWHRNSDENICVLSFFRSESFEFVSDENKSFDQ